MRNLIKVWGKDGCLFFPILFLTSCNFSDKSTSKSVHSVDTVLIQQMQFTPAELDVQMGDTVLWINKDMVDHNVTEEKSKAFYSDTLGVGKSWKMTVTGSADYLCTIHPTMKGKLVLK